MCSVQWFDSLITASAPLGLGSFLCSYKVKCSYRNLICTDIDLLLGLKTHTPILCSIHTFSAIIFCSSQIWMISTLTILFSFLIAWHPDVLLNILFLLCSFSCLLSGCQPFPERLALLSTTLNEDDLVLKLFPKNSRARCSLRGFKTPSSSPELPCMQPTSKGFNTKARNST